MTETFTCPICGYDGLDEPARSPSGSGSDEYCPSCAFQFGVTDDDAGYSDAAWRWLWIVQGKPWSSLPYEPQPPGWDPDDQLARHRLSPTFPDERFRIGQHIRLQRRWDRWRLAEGATGLIEVDHGAAPVYGVRMQDEPRVVLTVAHEDLRAED